MAPAPEDAALLFGSDYKPRNIHQGRLWRSGIHSANPAACPVAPRTRRSYALTPHRDGEHTGLPQQVDILERYRGLVVLGRIKYDEEQIRVITQVSHGTLDVDVTWVLTRSYFPLASATAERTIWLCTACDGLEPPSVYRCGGVRSASRWPLRVNLSVLVVILPS
jgi:hypothetical protein